MQNTSRQYLGISTYGSIIIQNPVTDRNDIKGQYLIRKHMNCTIRIDARSHGLAVKTYTLDATKNILTPNFLFMFYFENVSFVILY